MESDLLALCEGLKLTEVEKQEVEVSKEDVIMSVSKSLHCFMMCVVADKEVNRGALRSSLARMWQLDRKVIFKEVSKNLVLVELKERADKRRIMQGRPWSFDKNLLCIQDCEGYESWKEMSFQYKPFWVQCHDLPFAGMNANTGLKLGQLVGEVLEVDTDSSGICWGSCLRIKAMIDITKPLTRGRFLTLGKSKFWISFKFERLSNFCYQCGKIKHALGGCDMRNRGNAGVEGFSQQYGPWLRASLKLPSSAVPQTNKESEYGKGSGHFRSKGDGDEQQGKSGRWSIAEEIEEGIEEDIQAGDQGGRSSKLDSDLSKGNADTSYEKGEASKTVTGLLEKGVVLSEEGKQLLNFKEKMVEVTRLEHVLPTEKEDLCAQEHNLTLTRVKGHTSKWKRMARAGPASKDTQIYANEMEVDEPRKLRKRVCQEEIEEVADKRRKQNYVKEDGEYDLQAVAAVQHC
ncbi:hypothetical protein F2P56_023057 [Juglans regia]|uniref:Zinc knuckle CX2CX4HX4C domain-containing protein n=1 Tax=Juglans regia TaxID=51240 RepID=A0A833X3V4_JUGRE|nr:hypothetical protein F2P56_023057 [Juglans regia]